MVRVLVELNFNLLYGLRGLCHRTASLAKYEHPN
jgi:hypothetical protein